MVTLAAAALRFAHLAAKPFWFDECFSAEMAHISWSNFLHLLWWREANMSLYYLLLRIWLHFGWSPFFIRSLSVLVAAATVPAIYWLANLLFDRRVALVASALFAFNAYSVRYSQEARSYPLFVLLATLSSGFFVSFLLEPSRARRMGYVVTGILAVYAHFYALQLLAAHWLAVRLLAIPNASDDALRDAAARLRQTWKPIGVAVLPVLIFVVKTGAGPLHWIPRPGLRDVIHFAEHFSGGTDWGLLAVCLVAGLAIVLPLGRELFHRAQDWPAWRLQFLLIWLIFPSAVTILISFARPLFLGRYMIFCLPALVILVAAGLARLSKSWMRVAALAGILVLSLQGILFVYGHDFDDERDASADAVHFILDHSQPGDAIILHIAEARVPYEFFRSLHSQENSSTSQQVGPAIVFPHDAAEFDYRDFTGKPTPDLLHSAASDHPRLWLMLMYNQTKTGPDPTTQMLDRQLPQLYPKVECWQFYKVEVRLYSR
jgi:mannosyltransferase